MGMAQEKANGKPAANSMSEDGFSVIDAVQFVCRTEIEQEFDGHRFTAVGCVTLDVSLK